jgi:hypothetical protein
MAPQLDLLRCPLLPYQREGMLHLVFGERALLADDWPDARTSAVCWWFARLR